MIIFFPPAKSPWPPLDLRSAKQRAPQLRKSLSQFKRLIKNLGWSNQPYLFAAPEATHDWLKTSIKLYLISDAWWASSRSFGVGGGCWFGLMRLNHANQWAWGEGGWGVWRWNINKNCLCSWGWFPAKTWENQLDSHMHCVDNVFLYS